MASKGLTLGTLKLSFISRPIFGGNTRMGVSRGVLFGDFTVHPVVDH